MDDATLILKLFFTSQSFGKQFLFFIKKPEALSFKDFPTFFLASPIGFEPTACRLGGDRSILLSYGDRHRIFQLILYHFFYEKSIETENNVQINILIFYQMSVNPPENIPSAIAGRSERSSTTISAPASYSSCSEKVVVTPTARIPADFAA